MILARLAAGIRRQDWAAVVIEFVIVVAGILFALQADDWNRQRLARAEERAVLERLHDEMRDALAYYDLMSGRIRGWNADIERLIAALEAGDLDALTDDEIEVALRRSSWLPPLTPPRAILDKLVSAGQSDLLRDRAVALAVSHYAQELAFTEQILRDEDAAAPDVVAAAGSGVRRRLDPADDFAVGLAIDRQALRAAPALLDALLATYRIRVSSVRNHRADLREDALVLCNRLAQALGEPACRPTPAG
ncbi:MAG TPA: hypothetical protein VLA56_08790 [Pseudomonadales bacterium]|nr:hypothetical protein [Pseudomonadales bacterium]